jgi:hypothetical protein
MWRMPDEKERNRYFFRGAKKRRSSIVFLSGLNVTPVPISLAGFSCSGFPEKIIRKL